MSTNETTVAPSRVSRTRAVDVGLLMLRGGVGLIMAGHGSQKLFGWFGGDGLEATARGFAGLGYTPGTPFALLAGLSEFAGGLLLALGLLTPLAAAMVLGVMVNAMSVHWPAFWGTDDGIEYTLLYALVAVTLAFTGPGRYAADTGAPWGRVGSRWGVASVAVGLGAAVLALVIRAA